MQTHVAITSSVYLKNNTLEEWQQHFREWFEAFSLLWQKNNQRAVLAQTSFDFPTAEQVHKMYSSIKF